MNLHTHQAAWAARQAAFVAYAASFGIQARADEDDEIAELRRRQESLLARSQQVLDAADAEGRQLTADESRAIQRRAQEIERIEDQVAEIDTRLSQPLPRRTSASAGDPLGGLSIGSPVARSQGAARIAPMIDLAAPVVRPTFAAMFGEAPRAAARGEECTFGRWLNALAMGDSQFVLRHGRPNAASTLTGTDGGYAVPAGVSADLFNAVVEQSQFLGRCRVVPMAAQEVSFPVLNFSDRSKGPAELTAQKVQEGDAATKQSPKMRAIGLRAKKRITYWSCTSEMLQDSLPGTDQALIQAAAGAIAMELDREILGGSGVAAMLGITSAGCRVVHAKDSGQAANTVSFANLSGMIARLLPSSWRNAVWFINQTVLPQLFSVYNPVMNSTNVVGGLPAPLTQGPDGSYRLFGLPLVVSDFMPVLSSEGDIALMDLSRYVVGMREGLRIEVSRDFLFDSDEVAFKVVQRRDGLPIDDKAITPAVGSTTVSPFVLLGAR